MFIATVLMALREIRRNSLRSALTMLGVVIGVAAVIALVSVGRGATAKVTADVSKLGRNLLMVNAGGGGPRQGSTPVAPFKLADAQAIKRELRGVDAVAPAAQSQQVVVFGNHNARTQVTGTDQEFFVARGYEVESGRTFTESEGKGGLAVCLIGATVRSELFPGVDPIGSLLRTGKMACRVIGVLAAKGQAGMGQDQDDLVVMPLATYQRRISGNDDITIVFVSATEGRSTAVAAEQIRALLRQRRDRPAGSEDDFRVQDMAEITATVTSATTALTALLGAIAAVSLVVGGIGIMNIMLVSVTERTREIGIRLAIGAFAGEVMLQFLLEAVVLSTLGGIVGMLLGFAGSYLAARALMLPFVVAPDIVTVAFVFSAMVGVIFGYLPARRAARLNPIEALRHE
ncbi:MAG: ABC transporter permease, partial [Polyangiaceae bacterium]